jgi:agmatine/peptidylarginine deiminase
MITNSQTNTVFFSSLLTEKPEFKSFWKRLNTALREKGIIPGLLTGTKDIWCRDYMPVQINENTLLQYVYDPDYLKSRKYSDKKSNVDLVIKENEIGKLGFKIRQTSLILDGGNIIASKDTVILTNKIFTENLGLPVSMLKSVTPEQKQRIIQKVKEDFGVKEVIIIPRLPGDVYGHADGMVRFYSENEVLLNDDKNYGYFSNNLIYKLRQVRKAIESNGLKIKALIGHKDYENDFYINYLQFGKLIFLPAFGNKKRDHSVFRKFCELFSRDNVVQIPSSAVSRHEGVLNCISWTVRL